MNITTPTSESLGDLEKTVIINTLMQTPFDQRDECWRDRFLGSVDGANLKLSPQEVVIASDGYPYFLLETVRPDENFKAFVINQQLPKILQSGFGVVINMHHARPDWVFSYGDIVNLELNDEFYTNESIFSENQKYVTLSPGEKVAIGQPSENILPLYLRTQLRDFLTQAGVATPKAMLLARNYDDEQHATQDLVFNLTTDQFADQETFDEVLKTIAWFLPRHYSFLCIDETSLQEGFELL